MKGRSEGHGYNSYFRLFQPYVRETWLFSFKSENWVKAISNAFMYYMYGEILPVKTTVTLKDEIYECLVKRFGRRKISEAVNQALMEKLFKPVKSMFGADPWLTTEGLRNEEEPHEAS